TLEVRGDVAAVLAGVADAEASARGYLITGGEGFLEGYGRARGARAPALARRARRPPPRAAGPRHRAAAPERPRRRGPRDRVRRRPRDCGGDPRPGGAHAGYGRSAAGRALRRPAPPGPRGAPRGLERRGARPRFGRARQRV